MATEEAVEKEPTLDEEMETFYTASIEEIEKRRGVYWYRTYLRKELLGKYSQHEKMVGKAALLENPEKKKALTRLKNLKNLKTDLGNKIKEITGYRERE